MEAVLTLLYTVLFMVLICKCPYFKSKNISSRTLCLLFGIKVLAGVCMYMVYTYYYPNRNQADIFRYFDDAKVIYGALPDRPMDYIKILLGIGNNTPYFNDHYYVYLNHWERQVVTNIFSDSHTIIRFNALVMLFSFGYFNVHNVFASFLAFVGLFSIYKWVENNVKPLHKWYVVAIFLLPSVVFWTSGVLKESLIMFGVGLFIYSADSAVRANMPWYRRMVYILCVLLGAAVLVYTKLYYVLLIALLCGVFIWNKKYNIKHPLWAYIISALILTPMVYFIAMHYDCNALDLIAYKHNDMVHLGIDDNAMMADKVILSADIASFAAYMPKALYNALLLPLPFSGYSPMVLMAWGELLLLVAGMVLLLVCGAHFPVRNKNMFWFCILLFMANAMVIGISVPIIGAIVRYRCISLPFLMVAVCLCCDDYTMKKTRKKILKYVRKH